MVIPDRIGRMNNRPGTATMAYRTAAARTIIAAADEVGADQTHEQ
jgi:hypothetical protein